MSDTPHTDKIGTEVKYTHVPTEMGKAINDADATEQRGEVADVKQKTSPLPGNGSTKTLLVIETEDGETHNVHVDYWEAEIGGDTHVSVTPVEDDNDDDEALVTDGGVEDATDVDEPLDGYESETTGDYRQALDDPDAGDGYYDVQGELTHEIADLVTRLGGRIPVDMQAREQNEGYARELQWTVYAPASNPHHIAAEAIDLLEEHDDVDEHDIYIEGESAADAADHLRSTGLNYVFDREDESEQIERVLRELRWESGLDRDAQQALVDEPSSARERVETSDRLARPKGLLGDDPAEDEDGVSTNAREQALERIDRIARHPGDAWAYREITIVAHQEADDPHWG